VSLEQETQLRVPESTEESLYTVQNNDIITDVIVMFDDVAEYHSYWVFLPKTPDAIRLPYFIPQNLVPTMTQYPFTYRRHNTYRDLHRDPPLD
jgi:hypothetical protein